MSESSRESVSSRDTKIRIVIRIEIRFCERSTACELFTACRAKKVLRKIQLVREIDLAGRACHFQAFLAFLTLYKLVQACTSDLLLY
jgi:hypothetical protein